MLPGCVSLPLGDSESALVVEDLIARSRPSRLKAQTPQPIRDTVRYDVHGRAYQGDLYRSGESSLAALVLVPGLAPRGKDDPRLVAFAYTLARTRFAVLVPDLDSLRGYTLRSRDVREVADAFAYLASRSDLLTDNRAGVAAFSYAAGPALLAALEPDIRDKVRFVLSVGGYHAIDRVATFVATGYFQTPADKTDDNPRWQYIRPHAYAKRVFGLSLAALLDNAHDRKAIASVASTAPSLRERRMTDPLSTLTAGARPLYELLTTPEPRRASALMKDLPASVRAELARLDPAQHDLGRLRANMILLHGRQDNIIPFSESVYLFRAVPRDRVQLFLIDGLAHVDIRPAADDLPQLLGAIEALLSERQR